MPQEKKRCNSQQYTQQKKDRGITTTECKENSDYKKMVLLTVFDFFNAKAQQVYCHVIRLR